MKKETKVFFNQNNDPCSVAMIMEIIKEEEKEIMTLITGKTIF